MEQTHARTRRPRAIVSAAIIAAALLSGCGGSSKSADVTATQADYSIQLSVASVKAGAVSVDVRNTGAVEHELVVFRTDLGEGDLPMLADGSRIDENGKGITHLDPEAEGVKPGKDKTITVDLTPGRYVVVCNLAAHYTQGMHAVLTVT